MLRVKQYFGVGWARLQDQVVGDGREERRKPGLKKCQQKGLMMGTKKVGTPFFLFAA